MIHSAKKLLVLSKGHYGAFQVLSRLFVVKFKDLNHRKEKIISLLSQLTSGLEKKAGWPFALISGIIAAY